MTDTALIIHYGSRIKSAVNELSHSMQFAEGAKAEKAAILAMFIDILNAGSRMVEECTGQSDMLNRSLDSIRDDLSDAFDALIDSEAEEAEQRREEEEFRHFPRSVVATAARDVARL